MAGASRRVAGAGCGCWAFFRPATRNCRRSQTEEEASPAGPQITMKTANEELARLGQALESQNVEWRSVCEALAAGGSEAQFPKQVLTAFERIFDEAPPAEAAKPPVRFALRA